MNKPKYRSVFGPVPSRRLGRSLGIDLVPFKTCSYDCVYCQLGRTTMKTLDRREHTLLSDILEELDSKLSEAPRPDFITLSGSGEPTLYSKLGELISAVKTRTDIPVAVLTNGSLLWDRSVREELHEADLVIPSLDAGNVEAFLLVNRPHKDLVFDEMLDGLIRFRSEFTKQLWLELFLVDEVTGCDRAVQEMAGLVDRIQPDRVQLNTVIRPPAEESTCAVSKSQMLRFAGMFKGGAELIADFDHVLEQQIFQVPRDTILDLLKRRPCSLEDVIQGLGVHPNEVLKYLDDLLDEGTISARPRNGTTYYIFKGSEQL